MPKPDTEFDLNSLRDTAEVITCLKCGAGHGLEFFPRMEGWVWAQCRCGFGWDMAPAAGAERWVN